MTTIKTVKDLINELQTYDENLPILIESSSGEYCPSEIEYITFRKCYFCEWEKCRFKGKKQLVLYDEGKCFYDKEVEE